MVRHPFGILITLLMLAILALAIPGTAEEFAHKWHVNANGTEGSLEISTKSGARISGTLLGSPVEGWLVGRHLVLVRDGVAGQEAWEAWLGTADNGDDKPALAGTFLQADGNGPLPWFGTPRNHLPSVTQEDVPVSTAAIATTVAAITPSEQRPADQPEAPPQTTTAQSPEAPTTVGVQNPELQESPPVPAPVPVPHLPSGKPSLAGTWDTPDGPLTIRQSGSSLTFILPDREISGRLTGSDTLIGGFGPGCCKGRLEQGFAVITWDNGVSWYRK